MAEVVIIGAGAAGLMAAITAAKRGLETIVLERNARCGRKLLITGKGRCNVTNTADTDKMFSNIVTNSRFLYSALNSFGPQDICDFFKKASVPIKFERGGRVFPESDKSIDIVNALVETAQSSGASIITRKRVKKVLVNDSCVCGVELTTGEIIDCQSVIVCTGGVSYPSTGSTGDGYKIAKDLGHDIVNPRPALIPIVLSEEYINTLEGISLRNVTLELRHKKKTVFKDIGELVFTSDGISGPLALTASSYMKKEISEYKLIIDLKPALDFDKLNKRVVKDFEMFSNKQFKNALNDLLIKKLIPIFIELSKIDETKQANQITKVERERFVSIIKEWTLTPIELSPIDQAIVTSGGVSVKQVNPKTMASKIVSGLHFAGEILDVDALTGGYNLTIAFATGHAAGAYCLKL